MGINLRGAFLCSARSADLPWYGPVYHPYTRAWSSVPLPTAHTTEKVLNSKSNFLPNQN
jgi:hypothetical protein